MPETRADEGSPSKRAKPEGNAIDVEAIINKALGLIEHKWDQWVTDSEERWQQRVTSLLEMTEARTDKKITEAIQASEKKNEDFVVKIVEQLRKEFSCTGSSTGPGSPSVARAPSAAGTAFTANVDRRRSPFLPQAAEIKGIVRNWKQPQLEALPPSAVTKLLQRVRKAIAAADADDVATEEGDKTDGAHRLGSLSPTSKRRAPGGLPQLHQGEVVLQR